jgi:membrane-associated phospholipid phosphatase
VTDKALKKLIGRARPDAKESPWDIDPLANRQVSFPSGHAALAFTLATSLADDLHNTWSSIALYTFATGTAWSRLNDNRHWPSDVIGGAVLGFTVSRMMSNRWEILGIRPPAFLTEPASASP